MAAPGSSSQLLPRPPTGALRPPVAIGPADIDDGDNRKGSIPGIVGSALSLPSAEVLRPPVAMGPSDIDDGEGFRRGLVDRNLSMSSKTSFRTEGSGYTPWTYTPARVASAEEADGARRMGAPGYIGESIAVSGGWGIAETGFDPATVNLGTQSRRSRDSPQRPPESFSDAAAKQASVGFNPMVVSIPLPPETDRTGEQQNFMSGGAVASSAPAGPHVSGSISAREWARGGMGNLDAGLSRGRSSEASGSPAKLSSPGQLAAASLASSSLPAGSRWVEPSQIRSEAHRASMQAPMVIDRPQPFSALPRVSSRPPSLERDPASARSYPPAPQAGEGQDLLYREQQFRAGQDEHRRNVAYSLAEEWATNSRPFDVCRTPVITYPGGTSVQFQDHAYSFMHLATANAANRTRMIQSIESGQFLLTALEIYKACDPQMNGFLSWNDGECAYFIVRVFQQFGLTPPSESQIFQLYAQFDFDRNMFLDARECLCLADALARSMFMFEALNIPPATSNPGTPGLYNMSRAPSSGPTAATFILTPPPSDGAVVAYNPGQQQHPPPSWQWPHMANPQQLEANGLGVENAPPGYAMPAPEAEWRQSGPGAGEWPVSDWSWAEIGSLFGFKKGGQPKQKPMAPAPPPADMLLHHRPSVPEPGPAEYQARPYQIFRAPGGADREWAAQEQADAAPGGHLWPEEAWSWRGLGSLFAAPRGSPWPQQPRGPPPAEAVKLAAQCPACGIVYMEGSLFCQRCGLRRPEERGAPPADPPPPPKQPSYKKADINPLLMSADPDKIGSQPMPQASPSMASRPPPAPEVPQWRAEVELRKHILEVDLEELRVSMHSPDMTALWYQSTSYYVSLHPTAEPIEDISLPMDAPSHTIEGKHLVSKPQTAKKPPVDNGHPLAAVFKEKLKLTTDFLEPTLAGFVWGRKASLAAEELVLVGTFAMSLFDFNLQRKVHPWKVMDPTVDKPIGEVLIRHQVMTTPGPVQLPVLSEVKRTEVTINWAKPLNDHGSPIIGYKIDILVTPKLEGGLKSVLAMQGAETGPQWVTLDDCTKALTPAYVIKELEGNTSYMVNIQARNLVGPGDPCEFQIQTAPIEPAPPRKPWIQEARDGCLCVAWHAPDNDGGSQITAYRVQMMKSVGMASRIMAAFGKSVEGDAAWVNMGTVGAVMDEVKDQPSVYTVWAGPLDTQKCEYRFRVFAINAAGVSRESECTDPHFTYG